MGSSAGQLNSLLSYGVRSFWGTWLNVVSIWSKKNIAYNLYYFYNIRSLLVKATIITDKCTKAHVPFKHTLIAFVDLPKNILNSPFLGLSGFYLWSCPRYLISLILLYRHKPSNQSISRLLIIHVFISTLEMHRNRGDGTSLFK